MIRTHQLRKKYGSHLALEGLDLEVAKGEILGFLGPNGAGKSTTLRILSGFLPPTSGRASVDGLDLSQQSLAARRRSGYLPENFVAPFEMRVEEYLRFRARLKGMGKKDAHRRVQELSVELGFQDRLRQSFGALSKGFRQRVGLADSLLINPPALLLDEPFSGLDPMQRQEFRAILRQLAADGKAILFSSHVLPEVEELATRVQILSRGRSKAVGTLQELQHHLQRQSPVLLRVVAGACKYEELLQQGMKHFVFTWEERRPQEYLLCLEDAKQRPALVRWLVQKEVEILEFREVRPDLDQLFRSLVGEESA